MSPLAAANAFVRCSRWTGTVASVRAHSTHAKVGPTLQCARTCRQSKVPTHVAILIPSSTWYLGPWTIPKRYLDQFSRLCTAHPCAKHTDRLTTLRATSVAIGSTSCTACRWCCLKCYTFLDVLYGCARRTGQQYRFVNAYKIRRYSRRIRCNDEIRC